MLFSTELGKQRAIWKWFSLNYDLLFMKTITQVIEETLKATYEGLERWLCSKSAGCTHRGLEFRSQHPHQTARTPCNSGHSTLASSDIALTFTHIYRQNFKIKINLGGIFISLGFNHSRAPSYLSRMPKKLSGQMFILLIKGKKEGKKLRNRRLSEIPVQGCTSKECKILASAQQEVPSPCQKSLNLQASNGF